MVAGTLTSPRYALAAALAVSVAVHAAALGWWAPAVWWTSAPGAPSQQRLRATLVEQEVVAQAPAATERASPVARPSAAAAPTASARRPGAPPAIVSPAAPPDARAVAPSALVAAAPPEADRPLVPTLPADPGAPASAASGGAAATPVVTDGAGVGAAASSTASETTPIAYRDNPSPPYPDAARRDGQQGLTVLEVLVSREGVPLDVAIVATSGFSELDAAAAAGVRRWRFVPAVRDREPIDARIRIPVRFRLTADGR